MHAIHATATVSISDLKKILPTSLTGHTVRRSLFSTTIARPPIWSLPQPLKP